MVQDRGYLNFGIIPQMTVALIHHVIGYGLERIVLNYIVRTVDGRITRGIIMGKQASSLFQPLFCRFDGTHVRMVLCEPDLIKKVTACACKHNKP